MTEEKQKVVVLGGGITGLAAAFYLQKEVKEKKLPVDVTLVEATHRVGGKIQTVMKDGFIIERGPDSFLARKKSAARLAEEVGMADKLVSNTAGKSFVLAHERLHPMPGGSI
ncbi:MAG: protoporphyrinogen oxidase, partial [Bacillales bacterium]